MSKMRKNRILSVKRGQVTIPLWLRKKYKIEERSTFVIEEKKQGLLLKPVKSIWDMIGSGSDAATAEEMDKLLYKLRHEDEDE